MAEQMEPLLLLPYEIEMQQELFEATPLAIVGTYLKCFRSDGSQVRLVPKHVLEALAARFLLLMEGKANSLDKAFGGRVARQRNRIVGLDRDYEVIWDLMQAKADVDDVSPSDRVPGTPFEVAVERVAEDHCMSSDNVRRIYKKGGKS